jgi:hypothetical protein
METLKNEEFNVLAALKGLQLATLYVHLSFVYTL